jgi:hypothetical protein
MRHIIGLFLSAIIIISLAGCGADIQDAEFSHEEITKENETEEKNPEIYEPWMKAFAAAYSVNYAPIILLIDIDFDEIPEMFTMTSNPRGTLFIEQGFKFDGTNYIEIIHDGGLLEWFHLSCNIETKEPVWFSSVDWRGSTSYVQKSNIVDFTDLSNVTTEFFFGYYSSWTRDEYPSDEIITEEIRIMAHGEDFHGEVVEYSEMTLLRDEAFSVFEPVPIKSIMSRYGEFFINFDIETNSTLIDTDNLMEFFSQW